VHVTASGEQHTRAINLDNTPGMTQDVNTTILVGHVSTRDGARLHFSVNGRAHCGAGGALILGDERVIRPEHKAAICRRTCLRAIRQALDAALTVSMDQRRREVACRTREALRTPAEIAHEDQRAAEMREYRRFVATMGPALVDRECNEPVQVKTFADLKALHDAAIDRDRAERASQTALFGQAVSA
jgi:hypothetical protein